MKKWTMVLVLLLCGTCLFAQSFFNLVKTGTPEQVKAALNAGAWLDDRDKNGMTPLMYAARYNTNPNVIIILLNTGAKLDDRDMDRWTPLMYAAEFNENPDVIMALLNAGADTKLKDRHDHTALYYAQVNPELMGTSAYEALKKATLASDTPTVQAFPTSWVSTSFGAYRVERMWEEYSSTYVLVSYRNTTSMTFRSLVTITALVYDANNHMLDMNDRSFFVSDKGLIVPGFEGTVKISFSFVGAKRVEIRLQGH